MANNNKHMASIITSSFASSKWDNNIVSTFAVYFNDKVLKQHLDYMKL